LRIELRGFHLSSVAVVEHERLWKMRRKGERGEGGEGKGEQEGV
jgi:hypothetical protein